MNINSFGVLYVVATPIGNLQDISFRAIETLKSVNLITAEDTRSCQSLLRAYSIKTDVFALHEHNERECVAKLLHRLQQGESIALISDAGTPLISDPGYYLVREVRAAGVRVVPIPGACAAVTALSASGLPTNRFTFEGFLPPKSGARRQRLEVLRNEKRTMIFYEAPHRILDLLHDMQAIWGNDKKIVIGRELTKLFETITSGTLANLIDWVAEDSNQQRGEIVVLVEGCPDSTSLTQSEIERTVGILVATLPVKQAVELAVKLTGEKKNAIYEIALRLKQ